MTQEEKARAYDEALERARALWREAIEKEYPNDYLKDYETIFPELRESEDEKVIKALETFINQPEIAEKITFEARIEWLSWLEKKKEQKPWSEEDEKMLTGIIERGSVQVPPYTTALREEQIEWLMNRLKSIRPDTFQNENSRPKTSDNWKPSEEQLNALNFAITYFMHETNYKNPTELRELYDALLKLK